MSTIPSTASRSEPRVPTRWSGAYTTGSGGGPGCGGAGAVCPEGRAAGEDPLAPENERRGAALAAAAGRVVARFRERGKELGQPDAERRHARRIRLDVDLLDEA